MTTRLVAAVLGLVGLISSALATERADTAWQWVEEGAVVLDVRTPGEFAQGHLDEAINLPLDALPHYIDRLKLDKNQPIVTQCRSGNRSGQAELILRRMGYTRVHNGGGLVEMQQARP